MRYTYTTIVVTINTDPTHDINVWADKGYRLYCHMVIGDDLIFIMEKKIPYLESKALTADESFTDVEYWRSEEDEKIHQHLLGMIRPDRIDEQSRRVSNELDRRLIENTPPDEPSSPAILHRPSSELP